MTAEVAVINSTGVALAADSAVTIGSQKIYNSALKLFALSKTEPVGVMIYGNAALMNMPWETIIKIYRKELGPESFKTLPEYSSSFFSFLSSRSDFFPTEVQESWLAMNVRGYYELIFDSLIEKVEKRIKETSKIDEATTEEFLKNIVDEHHSGLIKRGFLDGLNKSFEDEVRKKYTDKIKSLREEVFNELPLSRAVVAKLNGIAAMLHSRDIFSQSTSGIVIAGFGTTDLYPSVETNEVEGVICGRIKKKRLDNKSTRILKGLECAVIPFAQDDMVASFMNGLNPSVHGFIISYLNEVFKRLPELFDRDSLIGDETAKNKALKQYGADIQSLLDNFLNQLGTHTQREHVQPIMQMVNALPKDELAAMAESLVNLTAFKRRMTRTLETVGGPIDVAVISKGDGLVWVKRKHYFPKELNQHFFANYYREI